jgi:hypothetical protein
VLVASPDCLREISDAAPTCIHCGRPATPHPPMETPKPASSRRRPLAGAAAGSALTPRAALRWIAVAAVIGLLAVRGIYGGRSEGTDLLLSALIPLAAGASLLLMPVPEATAARTPGTHRRGNWGAWFLEQDAAREFRWNVIAGWVFLLIGAVTLLSFVI